MSLPLQVVLTRGAGGLVSAESRLELLALSQYVESRFSRGFRLHRSPNAVPASLHNSGGLAGEEVGAAGICFQPAPVANILWGWAWCVSLYTVMP